MRFIAPALLALAGFGAAPAADTYQIDGAHTAAVFTVSHLGFSNTWGRFNDVSGTVTWDDADPAKSAVKVVIKAASVDTGNAKRDEHLRSGDFFSVKEFPELSFVSTSIAKSGDNQYQVTGDFTLHGVTKRITVPVVKMGQGKDPWGKERIGFDAEFALKRSEYGMSFMLPGVGDDVTVILATEGVK